MSPWRDDAPETIKLLIEFFGGPLDQLIAHLGESPEAWRGAIMITEFVRGMSVEVLEALHEGATSMPHSKESTLLLTLMMTALLSFYEHDLTIEMRRFLSANS